jgi:hypothetical protein
MILHVSDGPQPSKFNTSTSAAHGGTDSKNLKSLAIETETKMEI